MWSRLVEPLNQLQVFGQRRDSKTASFQWKSSPFVSPRPTGRTPFRQRQFSKFIQREVHHVPVSVSSFAVWKYSRRVRNVIQRQVVQHDRHTVFAEHTILFDVICQHCMSENGRFGCMFRQVTTRSTMSNDDRRVLSLIGRHQS
jgi:hypothetical protein